MPDQPAESIKWTSRQRKHMAWLATPKSQREPDTKEDWADVIGVNRRTLQRWERLPGFMDAVWVLARITLDVRLPDILEALAVAAEARNVQAIRLALEVSGRLPAVSRFEGAMSLTVTQDDITNALQELEAWENENQPQD
jgi:hypothetical protein